jgi:glucose-1-phosphate thymidylyltransferase
MQASQFVQVIEQRQGIKIACIEEIAYKKGFISKDAVKDIAKQLLKSGYGQYLMNVINDEIDY